MPVVFIIAIAIVLVGVYLAATGRGGEMSYAPADHAPIDLGPVSAADIALVRPPTALWGYNMQVTDETLDRIARAMRERDVRIAVLQRQLADAGPGHVHAVPGGAFAHQEYADPSLLPDDSSFSLIPGSHPEPGGQGEIPYNPEASYISDSPRAPSLWPDAEPPQHYAAKTEPDLPPLPVEPDPPAAQPATIPDIEPSAEASPHETAAEHGPFVSPEMPAGAGDPHGVHTTEPAYESADDQNTDPLPAEDLQPTEDLHPLEPSPLAENLPPAEALPAPEPAPPAGALPAPEPPNLTSDHPDAPTPPDPQALLTPDATPAAGPHEATVPQEAPQVPPFSLTPSYTPSAPPPQTPLVLKASAPRKLPEQAEYQPTEPSPVLESRDATQPSPVLPGADDDPQAPYDAQGPQGSYDTHGLWAQQQDAGEAGAGEPRPADESTGDESTGEQATGEQAT